jgi:hypothetical protein
MVTKGEAHAGYFLSRASSISSYIGAEFVVGADKCKVHPLLCLNVIDVESDGYLESVLDKVLEHASGKYILRLDDDEVPSDSMIAWLKAEHYKSSDVWAFPRANLLEGKAITTAPLWPDLQTRLTIKSKAGGRTQIHQGSPYGTGTVAPVAILHHKFEVRTFDERLKIASNYENVKPGCGFGIYQPYNLPERCFDSVTVQDIGAGYVPNWQDMTGKGQEVRFDS